MIIVVKHYRWFHARKGQTGPTVGGWIAEGPFEVDLFGILFCACACCWCFVGWLVLWVVLLAVAPLSGVHFSSAKLVHMQLFKHHRKRCGVCQCHCNDPLVPCLPMLPNCPLFKPWLQYVKQSIQKHWHNPRHTSKLKPLSPMCLRQRARTLTPLGKRVQLQEEESCGYVWLVWPLGYFWTRPNNLWSLTYDDLLEGLVIRFTNCIRFSS